MDGATSILAVCLLATSPHEITQPVRVDVIERNIFGVGAACCDQIILWDSSGIEWECVDWGWTDQPNNSRTVGTPKVVDGQWELRWPMQGVRVCADCYIITRTGEDRERQAARLSGGAPRRPLRMREP